MKATLTALLILLTVSSGSFAGKIQKGAIMDVKPNSIWFDEIADLAHWQALKKAGNATELASYQTLCWAGATPGSSSTSSLSKSSAIGLPIIRSVWR
jgi:hypothetical protein